MVGEEDIWRACLAPNDGKYLFVAELSGGLRRYDTTDLSLMKDFYLKAHEGECGAIVCSDDDAFLYSGGGDGALKKWDVKGLQMICTNEKQGANMSEIKSIGFI